MTIVANPADLGLLVADKALQPPIKGVRKVPVEVTMRQAQQALVIAGLYDQVQPLINAISDPIDRKLAQIEWDKSQVLRRGRPLVNEIGQGLGLTLSQIDDLLIFAATLP